MNDLTLITITHNLEEKLLKKYDEIIYMENGNVKEQGYFQELVNTLVFVFRIFAFKGVKHL